MTVLSGPEMHFESDPLYGEAMAHLQAGQWQEGIACLERLEQKHPDDQTITHLLEEAKFKAGLDARSHVRAKRWAIAWRPILWRALIVAGILLIAFEGFQILNRQIAPQVAQVQFQQRLAGLLAQGKSLLQAEKYDEAEAKYQEVLALAPDNPAASQGIAQAQAGRATAQTYAEAVKLQEAGQYDQALAEFSSLSVQSPGYRDVSQRISDIKQRMQLDSLMSQADAAFANHQYADAILKYQQIQQLSATYQSDVVSTRLVNLYTQRGQDVVNQNPPVPEHFQQALDDFTQALALQPKNAAVVTEQRLLSTYLAGQASYRDQQWNDAVTRLRAVYDERPSYLGTKLVVDPLYDAYIHSGDAYRETQDYAQAYEQYRKATELPVADKALALGRQESVRSLLTPTPTPANTPTTTPIPTPTAYIYVPPTALPSATPPPPLSTFRNQILFWADREDQPGLWVMNPDGGNRRFLGAAGDVRTEYDALRATEALSPDGRYRVYTTADQSPSAQIWIQGKDQNGVLSTWQVSNLTKLSYDPVWSPDGSLIAFVSTEKTSDDIWTVKPDGKDRWNRTPNQWEWDKHPSFSPDSQRIVFWTNREGTKQIYMMDRDGKNQHNISKVAWDEYDPLWVK